MNEPNARDIRRRLAFDVERLRVAAFRLERVEQGLTHLRKQLEARASSLGCEATETARDDNLFTIRSAQAQATANLARRSTLSEVLRHSGRLALIASMAVNRWVWALTQLSEGGVSSAVVKGHIDAGRVAHRLLSTWKPERRLKSGCGQLTSAVVVAEFVHEEHAAFVAEQIEEGLFRGRGIARHRSASDVLDAASRAIRAGAALLESMADRAEPAVRDLVDKANALEADLEAQFTALGTSPRRT